MANISNLAYVNPGAKIADNVTIDAFAYIDDNVVVGEGSHIHPHASVLSGARIGKNVKIFENAIISATPQDFRWKGAESFTEIGDNTTIREQVIINRSIYQDKVTKIGKNSFILAQSHIGHDSEIGNNVVLGNAVKIAGGVKIDDYAILSSNALVHENCHVGECALIKGGCRVNGNVPPFTVMAHNPIAYFGVNAYVMKLVKKSDKIIEDIAKCYRHIYQSDTSAFNALIRVKEDVEPSDERDLIIAFLEDHKLKIVALPISESD